MQAQPHLPKLWPQQLLKWFSLSSTLVLGWSGLMFLNSKPVLSAERIEAVYIGTTFSLPVRDLETYAQTGQLSSELQPYAQLLSPKNLAETRASLKQTFHFTPQQLARFIDAPIGNMLLTRFSLLIQGEPNQDVNQLVRNALTAAAQDPRGFTVLDVVRHFPGERLRINSNLLMQATMELNSLSRYLNTSLEVIAQASQVDIANSPAINFRQRPDLQQPGQFTVVRRTLDLAVNQNRQPRLTDSSRLTVDLFFPREPMQSAPVVVLSHGMSLSRNNFAYLAEHLASHGFVVAVPEHAGSNVQRFEALLDGQLAGQDLNPNEFVNRPHEIQFLLDELQRLNLTDTSLKGRLNLEQVGILGHSLGGYTSLALAGAQLNPSRLQTDCADDKLTLNLSLLVQCQAQGASQTSTSLADARVKAVFAISPLASSIFGPEGIANIRIPTLIMSGGGDYVTPPIPEQIHPFVWLNSPNKYLAVLNDSGHNFAVGKPSVSNSIDPKTKASATATNPFHGLAEELAGPAPELAQNYVKALSLAFMKTYLAQQEDYRPYLSASYAQHLSRNPVRLNLVRTLTPQQLQQGFGRQLPIPVIPPLTSSIQR